MPKLYSIEQWCYTHKSFPWILFFVSFCCCLHLVTDGLPLLQVVPTWILHAQFLPINLLFILFHFVSLSISLEVVSPCSRWFQLVPRDPIVIGGYRLFQVVAARSSLFQVVPASSRWFQLIPGSSTSFQVIPAWSSF